MAVVESAQESAVFDWLHDLGYQILSGPDIAPGEPATEWADGRLQIAQDGIHRLLSPHLP